MKQRSMWAQARLAPWRWQDGMTGLMTGAALLGLLLWERPALMQLWQRVLEGWRSAAGLSGAHGPQTLQPPSTGLLLLTTAGVLGLYALSGRWHERLRPMRAVVRALCIVQASACLFFAWAPARFPYSVDQHLNGLLQLGADFLTMTPLMLTLGWGLLRLPFALRLLGMLSASAYFVVWIPHQVLLHAWVLEHGSVLFMPVLMLCFGPLLNGWLFVGLYAWLVSLTPRHLPMALEPT